MIQNGTRTSTGAGEGRSGRRRRPEDWRRHGLRSPAELEQLVLERLGEVHTPYRPEPRYCDFFVP